jgi:hypothetical protein
LVFFTKKTVMFIKERILLIAAIVLLDMANSVDGKIEPGPGFAETAIDFQGRLPLGQGNNPESGGHSVLKIYWIILVPKADRAGYLL